MTEFEQKEKRLHELLVKKELDALLLQRESSFAWATCGASSSVNNASSTGEAMLLVTPKVRYLITNNIEAVRLEHEEKLADQGWKFLVTPWYESHEEVRRVAGGEALGADVSLAGAVDLSNEIARLRYHLTIEEGERLRVLGHFCANAMDAAIRKTCPGQSEHEIAAIVAREAQSRGVQAIVNLVAADERVYQFRHPLPSDKKLDRYAMLVLCGRRWGLVCSITRFIHFGPLPDDLSRKTEVVAKIDAVFIDSTCPNRKLKEVFQEAIHAYQENGYPDEWRNHHQGGPVGYEPRELIVTQATEDRVKEGQVYAWNPSIAGIKSEDSILIGEGGHEILTKIEGWPNIIAEANGKQYERPTILEIR